MNKESSLKYQTPEENQKILEQEKQLKYLSQQLLIQEEQEKLKNNGIYRYYLLLNLNSIKESIDNLSKTIAKAESVKFNESE